MISFYFQRRMNSDPSTREMVSKAYDFALLYIGHDKDSGEIWREYIDFVKAGEVSTCELRECVISDL